MEVVALCAALGAGIDNNVGTGFLAYVSGSTLNFSVAPASHICFASGCYEAA